MGLDKAKLLKARLPEAEVEIEGVGTVRVRGLSREEALGMQDLQGQGVAAIEQRMITLALLDPELTAEEVAEWYRVAPASEIEPVSKKVAELSGMTEGVAKRTWEEFESDPDAEFRVPAGRDAGDDRRPAGG